MLTSNHDIKIDFDAEKIVGDKIDLDEIILVDKPAGISSFGVVSRVRRELSELITKNYNATNPQNPVKRKKVKVGHAGTLDPFATGLLILLAGKATKRSNEFLKLDKVYEAEAILGQVSTTGDPEGELTEITPEHIPTKEEVEAVAKTFVGEIEQKVPAFSAIKINGRRAYDLARKGEIPDTPTRKIKIYSLEILEYSYPSLKYCAHVSSGTYIRTLSEDLGKALKTGAYTKELRRTQIGKITLVK